MTKTMTKAIISQLGLVKPKSSYLIHRDSIFGMKASMKCKVPTQVRKPGSHGKVASVWGFVVVVVVVAVFFHTRPFKRLVTNILLIFY